MTTKTINVLLIEDNRGDYVLILQMLDKSENVVFEITHAPKLSSGLEILESATVDVVLLDLDLPDSKGLKSFKSIFKKYHYIPIIILTGLADEEIGIKSIKYGAQDYLVKGEFNGKLLARAIQYAVERKKLEGLFVY